MMQKLKKTAANHGLPFGNRKKTYNSRLAQELGKWAESNNAGDAFHKQAFKAYFVDGKNIAELSVLLDLAEYVGLNREEAESVLLNRTFKNAVDEDWALSGKKDIRAVPTFMISNDRLVGAQSYPDMERWVISNGVKKKV